MMASVRREPNAISLAQARCMLALLASICSMGKILRVSSLPEGSPTRVVPPPMSTIGLLPVFCSQCSIMRTIMLPTWNDGAVQSKPM